MLFTGGGGFEPSITPLPLPPQPETVNDPCNRRWRLSIFNDCERVFIGNEYKRNLLKGDDYLTHTTHLKRNKTKQPFTILVNPPMIIDAGISVPQRA